MRLYEITDNMRELQAMAESGDLSEEDIRDTMDALCCEFEEKAEAVLKVRQSMLGAVAIIEKEIERLTNLKKAPEKSADRLGDYLKKNMMALGKDKCVLGVFSVTLKKPTLKLGVFDEKIVPPSCLTLVPEYYKVDRAALLRLAKESAIQGIELIESERALIIK